MYNCEMLSLTSNVMRTTVALNKRSYAISFMKAADSSKMLLPINQSIQSHISHDLNI
jgi:hypothetical protein